MQKNVLLMLALLCTVVQGAWADTWDGTISRPTFYRSYNGYSDVVVIRTGAELAYVYEHWDDDSGDGVDKDYYEHNMYLEDDLDLSRFIWLPLGRGGKGYQGTFMGNGHTIHLIIEKATDNYQGLFNTIGTGGCVRDLRVSGRVQCNESRLVGGIAGQNKGLIINCWVSADVISWWKDSGVSVTAKVGGICGENNGNVQYCCMAGNVTNHDADVGGIVGYNTGTINHVTFYGTCYSIHSQDNEYVGDQDGNLWNQHSSADLLNDTRLESYLNSFRGNDFYRFAVKYPYSIVVQNEGNGAFETAVLGSRQDKTIRLTKVYGASPQNVTLTDSYNNPVYLGGNATDGYTFTMPKRDVFFTARFGGTNWIEAHKGTQADPYLISSTEDWNTFSYYVRQGYNFYQQFVKLTRDITVTTTVGLGEEFPNGMRPFCGTFLGEGHTLTANLSSTATGTGWNEQGVAPFHFIFGATIKDLTVAGTISSASYHTAGIVGFAYDTNLIENCTVTATLNVSNNYAGGIIGHGENSATTIKDCVFAGTINGVGGQRANIGGIWGWSNTGKPVFVNCLEKGTYNNISSMHPIGLHGSAGTITDCYYLNPQIGTPDLVSTVDGAWQVYASVLEGEVCKQVMATDGTSYHLPCQVTGIKENYVLVDSSVKPDMTMTWKGNTLTEEFDYTVAYANNTAAGNASVTIRGKGNYSGQKVVNFAISGADVIDVWWPMWVADYHLLDGHTYVVKGTVDLDEDRAVIDGNVVLVLSEGSTLNCTYGIELGEGKTLTIEGPGTLKVMPAHNDQAGIGAYKMGTLIINGGNIDVAGSTYGAGIGGSRNNCSGGRIVINGGVVKATGGWGAAGIGGGYTSWAGSYGVCGDIVINGGQVTAISGENATYDIGHGSGGSKSGTLTLGWTNPEDYLYARSLDLNSITFANGKQFVLDGTQTIATAGNIAGKKIVPYEAVGVLPGNGTAGNPFTINSAVEWDVFTKSVCFGNSYSGQYVKLTADISVNQTCGYVTGNTPSKAFCGTFLGEGHTITASINGMKNQGTALFCYINGATIKNLTVAGTIIGNQKHTAGLVGFASGTNLIEGCTVTATLHIRSDYAGGIVGHGLESATTIRNCLFAGTVNGIGDQRSNVGGIWGWCDGGTPVLENCMEKGTYSNIRSMHPIGLQNTAGTITACYYLNPTFGSPANSCTVGGAYQVSTSVLQGEISKQLQLMDGSTYYVPCVISGMDEFYELPQGGLSITPAVTLPDGTPLTHSSDYTALLDGQEAAKFSVNATGKYTLLISGAGSYIGSKSVSFEVFDPILGDGTQSNPYVIRNANEWALFATLVSRGNDFSGQYVKLGDDMTVTAMAGASTSKAFKGTFMGDGKTLTFNTGTASQPFGEDYCAPFRYIDGATIQDLKVAGDIYTYKKFAAGLVANGSGTIKSCQISTVIHSSTSGDGTHAGLVALPSGTLTITECIYAGRLLTTKGTQYCGGFVGWRGNATVNVSSSLYAPKTTVLSDSPAETDINGGATFVRGGSVGTDCFYTQTMGEAQGTKVYDEPVSGELCMKAQAADGNWYYLPVTVSGIDATYMLDATSISINPTVAGYGTTNPVLSTDYTATLNGNAVTSFPLNITQGRNYTLVLTAVGESAGYSGSKVIEFVVRTPLEGEGTETNPYLISSAENWNLFVTNVADGNTYNGKFLKLNANISVSTMVGTNSAHSFMGTFIGDADHTLTFTHGLAEAAFNEDYCAPFRYVNGATIQNLKVAGNIYTSKKFAAGLVGQSNGTSTITGCQVSTVIHSSTSGDGTHGGIVAMPYGPLTITDCIYDGRLLTTTGTTHCGGFVGWHNGQDIAVSSSLYAPNTTLAGSDDETAITAGATFVRGGNVGSYCYYTAPMGETQGTQVYATLPAGELCIQAEAADGKKYYLPCTVGGIKPSYSQEAGIGITPVVTGLDHAPLTFATDYTAMLDGNAVASYPISITTEGEHTLTFTGKSADYTGTKSIAFIVTASLKGEGTAENPYLISSTEDWTLFATNVADSISYSGRYVKLTADIDITMPVGVREDKPFSGIFLGNGKTLTANISNIKSDEQGAAPFRYIKDATIKDVTVAGTIASVSRHTAGLVGFADGTNQIEGCTVAATLNVSSDYAGGFVGHGLTSATTLRDCVFAGTINGIGGDRPNMGGIWGWSDSGTPVLMNCLEKGTYNNISSMHPMGLQHAAGSITDCYYVNPMIGTPDHACSISGAWQVSAAIPAGDIYRPMTAVDGNTYYMLCTVGDMNKIYQHTGNDITVVSPTVTANDGTVLTEGTDYTCATSPAVVNENGDYTLTISGMGSYGGSTSIPFTVSDVVPVTSASTVLSGENTVYNNVTIEKRITISGNVVLNLGEGTTLTAPKGIELSKGDTLTINGPGSLIIEKCDEDKSAIGAVEVGTLVINGGNIKAHGGKYAAGIGGDKNNTSGGSITINGGTVNAFNGGLLYAAGIGGGHDDQVGHYGVCGDIVINGGQVTVGSFTNAIGQGAQASSVNDSTYISGTLTLGWTNPDDFFYDCSLTSYLSKKLGVESVTFADGKQFVIDGTTTIVTTDNMMGRKLVPYFTLSGKGTEDEPYTIASTEQWDDFANYVNHGYSFSGKHVKLTADSLNVTALVGIDEVHAFSGIFDGGSHTIIATIADTEHEGTALFRYIDGATIKNVLVAGSITGGMYAAAIVGFAKGTGNSMTNCAATATVCGSSHIGGLLGHALDSDMAISGCVHAGLMTGDNVAKGAIIGWGDDGGTKSVTDCLYLIADGQDTDALDLVKGHGTVTVTNCYKTTMAEYQESQNQKNQSARRQKRAATDMLTAGDEDYDITDLDAYGIWANVYDVMPDYFGQLLTDYGFLKVYEGGLEYEGYYLVASISLADNADNSPVIGLADEYVVDVTLTDRTFRKDGTWQTLCLPFAVDDFAGTPLEGARVMTLGNSEACKTGFDAATGTLTLDFVEADRIEPGVAYIVKWEQPNGYEGYEAYYDISSPMFRGMTVDGEVPADHVSVSQDGYVQFVGTYSSADIYTAEKTNLYLDTTGTLCYPWGEGMTSYSVNACSAYFQLLNGLTAGDAAADVRAFNLIFGDDEATGIISANPSGSMVNTSDAWYTISGMKLGTQPSQKGVYIYKGNKVVIK